MSEYVLRAKLKREIKTNRFRQQQQWEERQARTRLARSYNNTLEVKRSRQERCGEGGEIRGKDERKDNNEATVRPTSQEQ